MKYSVDWEERAVAELTSIWIASENRAAVTVSATNIERMLGLYPLLLGESRASSVQRVTFSGVVGVEYEVIEDDFRVIIQAVFRVG